MFLGFKLVESKIFSDFVSMQLTQHGRMTTADHSAGCPTKNFQFWLATNKFAIYSELKRK
jgi:hypothetical protein